MAPVTDPVFYALAVPAVLIFGVSKGGFGGALGVLAVPLLSFAVDPREGAAILLPILCLMDVFGVWAYRGRGSRPHLALMIPAAAVGVGLGTLGFGVLDERWVRGLLAVIAMGFSADFVARDAFRRGPGASFGTPGWGRFWSAMAGFTSFVAHAGGPPANVYLLAQRLDKTTFVATTVWFFAAVNLMKLLPYGLLGRLDGTNLGTSLVLAPLAPMGVGLGLWLHHRVDQRLFFRVCYAGLFLTGMKLAWDASFP